MKKKHLTLMPAVAIALLASCSAEQANTPDPSPKEATKVYMEVTAAQSVTPSATRTAYKEDGKTDAPGLTATWSTGDKLGVIALHYDSDNDRYSYDAPSADDYLTGQGEVGEATMTFAGTPTKSDVDQYIFYYPVPDGTIGKIDETRKAVIYDFTGQTCNLPSSTAELGKRDVMYTPSLVNPADGPIELTHATAVLRFDLKLPQDTKDIQSIEFRKTNNNIFTRLWLIYGYAIGAEEEDKSTTLSLEIKGDEDAPNARTITAYMMTYPFSISADEVVIVSATADDGAVYSHTFAPRDLDISRGQVHAFAPEAELVKEKVESTTWAGSNIYWDDTNKRLTFDPAGTTTHQYYQGVFFKWGSLVGISPAWDNNSDTWTGNETTYVPSYNANDPEATTWTTSHAADYESIPYYVDPDPLNKARDKNSLYGKQDLWKDSKGDICQFLGTTNPDLKGYHMPRSEEFGEPADWYTRKDGNWNLYEKLKKADGTEDLSERGYVKFKASDTFLPAAGFRSKSGELHGAGSSGNYFSSSGIHYNASYAEVAIAYTLEYTQGSLSTFGNNNVQDAFPVRCIKDK